MGLFNMRVFSGCLVQGRKILRGGGDPYLSLEFDKRLGAIHIYKDINME